MTLLAARPPTTRHAGGRRPAAPAAGRRLLRPGWPVAALFIGYPVWWALGLSVVALPLLAVPMAVALARRPRVLVPPGFGVWLLFLLWVALGAFVLLADAPGAVPGGGYGRYLTFGLRLSYYLGATVLLLYVGNLREDELPVRRVVDALGALFVITTAGGLLGMLWPTFEFTSISEVLLPDAVANALGNSVHPTAAQVQNILGAPEARPAAPFSYTNSWGAALCLLLPFFLVSWCRADAPRRRRLAPLVLAVAAVALIASLNRGAWIGLLLAAGYLVTRGVVDRRPAVLVGVAAAGLAVTVALAASPLGTLIQERIDNPHSNERRGLLVEQTVTSALSSPVVGFGSTRPVQGNLSSIAIGNSDACNACAAPPLGTHGHLWLVVFSQGFAGAALFFGFLAAVLLRHWRDRSPYAVASVASLVMFLLFSLYYNLLPDQLAFVLAGAGVLWRLRRQQPAAPVPDHGRAARLRSRAQEAVAR